MTDDSPVRGSPVTQSPLAGSVAGGGVGPAMHRGYRLMAGLLMVVMLGGTLPVPLYVLWERQMGFGPLGVTVVFAAVVSTFFAAAYLGMGLPPVLTGLISLAAGTMDASAWTSGISGVIVAAAIVIVLRTFGTIPAAAPPSTPSDSWCRPAEPGPAESSALGAAAAKMDCPTHKAGIVSSWLQRDAGVRRAS